VPRADCAKSTDGSWNGKYQQTGNGGIAGSISAVNTDDSKAVIKATTVHSIEQAGLAQPPGTTSATSTS
jgi:hypothetical protein